MLFKTLLFAVILLGLGVFFSFALAQESNPTRPTPSPVDYTLPYPGLLPDHPLFFVKTLRDKILLLLITNQNRRVEFYQLLSDKYISMAAILAQDKKTALAIKTLNQGVEYMRATEAEVLKLPPTKSDAVGNLKHHFELSLVKYQQVLAEQVTQFSGEEQRQWYDLMSKISMTYDEFEESQ